MQDLYVTYPNVGTGSLKAHLNIPKSLQAPIVQNQKVGTLELNFDNKAVASSPVYALENNPKASWWSTISRKIF